jgi:hypothetical protein
LRAHAIAFELNGPQRRSISAAHASRATRCAAASVMYADTLAAWPASTAARTPASGVEHLQPAVSVQAARAC